MSGIEDEVITFIVAVISGQSVRLFYRIISCIRAVKKHKKYMVEIEDILFWIGCSIYLFVQIYYTRNGVIRWYFALGIVVGVVFCNASIRVIRKMSKKICEFCQRKTVEKIEKKRYY